jgi:hypothetical protein
LVAGNQSASIVQTMTALIHFTQARLAEGKKCSNSTLLSVCWITLARTASELPEESDG